MATYGITDEGFVIKPREQILTDLNSKFLNAFGSSFDTSPSSPDGQVIGIMADALYEGWLREEAAYNQFIPSKTSGQGLDSLVELNGIERIVDKPTTVICQLAGNIGVLIPQGSLVETIEGLQFKTTSAISLPDEVTCECITLGALPINANEVTIITEIDTPIVGWTGTDNSEAGITGIVRQTDADL